MSSIACLRALLADQKKREVELLRQLISIKKQEIDEPRIDLKLHQSSVAEIQTKLEEEIKIQTDLNNNLENVKAENNQLQQNIYWYQNNYQALTTQFNEYEYKIKSFNAEIVSYQSKLSSLQSTIQSNESLISQQNEKISSLSQRETEYLRNIQTLSNQINSLEISHQQILFENEKTIQLQSDTIQDQKEDLSGTRYELSQLQTSSNQQSQELSRLQSTHQDLQTEYNQLTSSLQEKEILISTHVNTIETCQNQLQQWTVYDTQITSVRKQLEDENSRYINQIKEYEYTMIPTLQKEIYDLRLYNEQISNELLLINRIVADKNMIEIQLNEKIINNNNEYTVELDRINQLLIQCNQKLTASLQQATDMTNTINQSENTCNHTKTELIHMTDENNKHLQEMHSLNQQLQSYQQQLEESKTEVSELNETVQSLNQKIDTQTQQYNDDEMQIATHLSTIATHLSTIETYKVSENKLNIEISDIKKEHDRYVAESEEKLKYQTQELSTAHTHLLQWHFAGREYESKIALLYAEMEEKNKAHQIKNNHHVTDIKKLKDETIALNESINQLTLKNNNIQSRYSELSMTHNKAMNELEHAQSELTMIKRVSDTTIDDLNNINNELKLQNEECNTTMITLTNRIDTMDKAYQQCQMNLQQKEQENDLYTDKINELQSDVSNTNQRIFTLQNEFNLQTNQYQQLQQDFLQRENSWQQKEDSWRQKEDSWRQKEDSYQQQEISYQAQLEEKSTEITSLKETIFNTDTKLSQAIQTIEKWNLVGQEYESQIYQLRIYGEGINKEKSILENTVYQYNTMNAEINEKYQLVMKQKEMIEKKNQDMMNEYLIEKTELSNRIIRFDQLLINKGIHAITYQDDIKRLELKCTELGNSQQKVMKDLNISIQNEILLQERNQKQNTEMSETMKTKYELQTRVDTVEKELKETQTRESQYAWNYQIAYQRVNELEQAVWYLQEQLSLAAAAASQQQQGQQQVVQSSSSSSSSPLQLNNSNGMSGTVEATGGTNDVSGGGYYSPTAAQTAANNNSGSDSSGYQFNNGMNSNNNNNNNQWLQ